jgi:hypothetical protein
MPAGAAGVGAATRPGSTGNDYGSRTRDFV